MKILKFGQSTLVDNKSFEKVLLTIENHKKESKQVIVVVSALNQVQKSLLAVSQKAKEGDNSYKNILQDIEIQHFDIVKQFIDVKHQAKVLAGLKVMLNDLEDILHGIYLLWDLSPRTSDHVSSYALKMCAYVVSECLKQREIQSQFIDAQKLIATNQNYGNATPDMVLTMQNIKSNLISDDITYVVTGGLGATTKGESTTLGNAASTYTACILGSVMNAKQVILYTDKDGITNTDASLVSNAYSLDALTYAEAMELSHFNTKMIYPPSLQPAFIKNIPILIKNLYNPDFKGTSIVSKQEVEPQNFIKANSTIAEISLLSIQGIGMIGVAGTASRVFKVLAENQISIILIIQASSEHSITLAIAPENAIKAQQVLAVEFAEDIALHKIDKINVRDNMSIVAIIGEKMQQTPGIAGKIFSALGENGINISAIAQGSSEFNITLVIEKRLLVKTLEILQKYFA